MSWQTVQVEVDDGIAWVELNRPEKRNAMNPTLNAEMVDVLLTPTTRAECSSSPVRATRSLRAWT